MLSFHPYKAIIKIANDEGADMGIIIKNNFTGKFVFESGRYIPYSSEELEIILERLKGLNNG